MMDKKLMSDTLWWGKKERKVRAWKPNPDGQKDGQWQQLLPHLLMVGEKETEIRA